MVAGGGPPWPPPPPDGPGGRRRLRPWHWVVLGVVAALFAAALSTGGHTLWRTPAPSDTPAATDLLEALTPGTAQTRYGIDLPATDRPTVLRGWDFGVRVTGHGQLDGFDQDGTAYGPADGHRLYALALTGIDGERVGTRTHETTLKVRIGDRERSPRSAASLAEDERRVLLVSVPEAAETAELVLSEDDLSQTVSLTTGAPGTDNPPFLAREDVTSGPMLRTGTVRYRIASDTSSLTVRKTARYRLTSARLSYRHLYRPDEQAARDSAFLFLTGTMTRSGGKESGLPPEWLSLRLPDGTTRNARTHSDDTGYRWLAFEVPADFTDGTLVFGGKDRFPGTDNPMGITLTVESEEEERLAIVREPLPDPRHRADSV